MVGKIIGSRALDAAWVDASNRGADRYKELGKPQKQQLAQAMNDASLSGLFGKLTQITGGAVDNPNVGVKTVASELLVALGMHGFEQTQAKLTELLPKAVKPIGATVIAACDEGTGLVEPAPEGRSIAGGLAAKAVHLGSKLGMGIPPSPLLMKKPGDVADQIRGLLSYGAIDWAVLDGEARESIDLLHRMTDIDLKEAVSELEPKFLTRLEENLGKKDRKAYSGALDRVRAARNLPVGFQGRLTDLIGNLSETLVGFLKWDTVSKKDALESIDTLRRLPAPDFEKALMELGPSKCYRLIASLAEEDKAAYSPTIDRIKSTFFGAVLRAAEAAGLGPKDASQRFAQTLADVQAGKNQVPANAKNFAYFLVPGLVTEHQPGYMEENEEHLQKLGLSHERSKIDTDADVETNAAQLRQEIKALAEKTGKQVVVISHSKGGPDMVEALQDPATEDCVHRFVPMQAACGTPVASTLMEGFLGRTISRTLKGFLGATNGEALSDLDYKHLKERTRRGHPLKVVTLSLATTVGQHPSALSPVSDLMNERYAIQSDGLVPLMEQQVPGENAHVAILDDVDHAAPVGRRANEALKNLQPKYTPAQLTEALITQALNLPDRP